VLWVFVPPYRDAGVELVEALHRAVTEAVTQVLLHEVGMVQDVVGHQRLLNHRGKKDGGIKYERELSAIMNWYFPYISPLPCV